MGVQSSVSTAQPITQAPPMVSLAVASFLNGALPLQRRQHGYQTRTQWGGQGSDENVTGSVSHSSGGSVLCSMGFRFLGGFKCFR